MWPDAIAEIKRRVPLPVVVGRHTTLRRRGDKYLGLCPFHREKTPSFYVFGDRYKCFGCDAKGDVIDFLQRQTGLSFKDAVSHLAEEIGLVLPNNKGSNPTPQHNASLFAILAKAQHFFTYALHHQVGKEALTYLCKKRLLQEKDLSDFGIGFAANDELFLNFLHKRGVNLADAETLGLVYRRGNQFAAALSGRITIPIYDVQGRVIAFGARTLCDQVPKYLNTKNSPLYHKGKNLFGLQQSLKLINENKNIVIVEGYFDVIAIIKSGFAACAPCGTNLSDDHLQHLQQFNAEIILCFDDDKAGKRAHLQALKSCLRKSLVTKSVNLDAKDADAAWLRSPTLLQQSLFAAKDAMEDLIEKLSQKPLPSIIDKQQAVAHILPIVNVIDSSLLRNEYLSLVARKFNLDLHSLKAESRTPALNRENQNAKRLSSVEKVLVQALAAHPHLIKECDFFLLNRICPNLGDFLQELQRLQEQDLDLSAIVLRGPFAPQIAMLLFLVQTGKTKISHEAALGEILALHAKIFATERKLRLIAAQKAVSECDAIGDIEAIKKAVVRHVELSRHNQETLALQKRNMALAKASFV